MAKKTVIVVGAGFTGLAAAYELAKAGIQVQVVEAEEQIGGLAGTFEISPGYPVEKFYHHLFSSDRAMLDWIKELGAADKVVLTNSKTGLYFANDIFRLSSPLDLLRFTPLPLVDRLRTGFMALAARRIDNWRKLERISAAEWIQRFAGKNSYEIIWKPLLAGKFGVFAEDVSAVWFWNKLKLRGSSRDSTGKEQLAYFRGGFSCVLTAARRKLEELGVTFRLGFRVSEICSESARVSGVRNETEFFPADSVLATVPLPLFLQMTPALPEPFLRLSHKVKFLGNVCLVLRLRHSLSDTYWLNITDPYFPFVGIIEHTNFDPPENYGGEKIVYLSKYLPTTESLFNLPDAELFEFSLPHVQRLFPLFTRDWVIGYRTWRAEYSQPIVTTNYSLYAPPHRTPIAGLWLATMAQIYPEDRGTNYAVRMGRSVAQKLLSELVS